MTATRPQPARGDYRGKQDVFGRFFAGIGERSGGTFAFEIEAVLADDERVVVLCRHAGSREGRTLDTRDVDVYRLRDGRVIEARSTSFHPNETDEFWS